MPEIYPGLITTEYWTIGIIGAIILFISVLLHELAHSIIALKYGLNVHQIILFVFGGVSDIEEKPQEDSSSDFRKEFKIAIVGPVTSFIIAGILGLSWLILSSLIAGSGGGSSNNNNSATGFMVGGGAACCSSSIAIQQGYVHLNNNCKYCKGGASIWNVGKHTSRCI